MVGFYVAFFLLGANGLPSNKALPHVYEKAPNFEDCIGKALQLNAKDREHKRVYVCTSVHATT